MPGFLLCPLFPVDAGRLCYGEHVHTRPHPHTEASALARKPNYDFEKRMKESARKAKKDAKRNERLQRKSDARAEGASEDSPGEGEDAIDDAGDESVPE